LASFDLRVRLLDSIESNLRAIQERAQTFSLEAKDETSKKVFVYWGQGFNEAPPIVKVCLRELENATVQDDLVHLTDWNLNDWLKLPEIVTNRTMRYRAHYSDIIRVGLLAKWGGTWVDSTVWVATDPGSFGHEISKASGFFCFRNSKVRISSWFLTAEQGNYVPSLMFSALCHYWENNEELIGYFMFHELFECLYFVDKDFARIVDQSSFSDARNAHVLQRELLFKKYHKDRFTEICKENPIQKLTYKTGKRKVSEDSTFKYLSGMS
jgi:hypothetical protein